jgi:hypothetical protein
MLFELEMMASWDKLSLSTVEVSAPWEELVLPEDETFPCVILRIFA